MTYIYMTYIYIYDTYIYMGFPKSWGYPKFRWMLMENPSPGCQALQHPFVNEEDAGNLRGFRRASYEALDKLWIGSPCFYWL